MKKTLLTIILSIVAFTPTIKASNDNPKIVSEIVKDNSLDFNVTLSEMELDTTKEYEWSIVENQDESATTWTTVDDLTETEMNIYLDFSNSNIGKVIHTTDTSYLIVREKETQNIITDHAKVNTTIPYAYGIMPKINNNVWSINERNTLPSYVCGLDNVQYYLYATKITDKNIIDEYYRIKGNNEEINKADLQKYIDSLELSESDIPNEWNEYACISGNKGKFIGITENALYFVWTKATQSNRKTIYGVTIYDNGYNEINNDNKIDPQVEEKTTNIDSKTNLKQTSNTTENPKTGVKEYISISFAVIIGATIAYIVIRRKNKFKNI